MEAPLDLETFYRLLSSPEFVSRNTLLPAAPDFITELHQALVDKAMFPCPEPDPAIAAPEEDEDDAEGAASDQDEDENEADEQFKETAEAENAFSVTENRKPKTENLLLQLQQHFPDLESPPAVSATKPGHRRDKSVTKARQTRRVTEISLKIKKITSAKKLS